MVVGSWDVLQVRPAFYNVENVGAWEPHSRLERLPPTEAFAFRPARGPWLGLASLLARARDCVRLPQRPGAS